ncbi:MAG: hypothetical protein AB7G28_24270 [Pirellulales bacterium]
MHSHAIRAGWYNFGFGRQAQGGLVFRPIPQNIESVDDQLAEVLRTKTPAEKIEMVAAANRTARLLAAAGVRYTHPDWDEAQIQAEVIRRVCGGTK